MPELSLYGTQPTSCILERQPCIPLRPAFGFPFETRGGAALSPLQEQILSRTRRSAWPSWARLKRGPISSLQRWPRIL